MKRIKIRGLHTSPWRTPHSMSYGSVSPYFVMTRVVPCEHTSRAKSRYHSGILTRRSASCWDQKGTRSYAFEMSCSIVYAVLFPFFLASSRTSSRLSSGCSVPLPGKKAPCILPMISGCAVSALLIPKAWCFDIILTMVSRREIGRTFGVPWAAVSRFARATSSFAPSSFSTVTFPVSSSISVTLAGSPSIPVPRSHRTTLSPIILSTPFVPATPGLLGGTPSSVWGYFPFLCSGAIVASSACFGMRACFIMAFTYTSRSSCADRGMARIASTRICEGPAAFPVLKARSARSQSSQDISFDIVLHHPGCARGRGLWASSSAPAVPSFFA